MALFSSTATGIRPSVSNNGARLLSFAFSYAINANVSLRACLTSLLGSFANSAPSSCPYAIVFAVNCCSLACLSSRSSSSLSPRLGVGLLTPNCSSSSIWKSYSSVAVELRLLGFDAECLDVRADWHCVVSSLQSRIISMNFRHRSLK